MKWIIVITMFMFDPLHVGDDAVVMISQHDEPLVFDTIEECGKHVTLNLDSLIAYANLLYKDEGIAKEVLCVKDPKRNNAI